MTEKGKQALLDLLHLLIAGVLTVFGVTATGDVGNDLTAVAFGAAFFLLKALNPVDSSFGLERKE